MTPYEAKYVKSYSSRNCAVTVVQKLGHLIDSNWHYSWHWPKDVNGEFIKQVRGDLKTELDYAKQRLHDLELADKLLNEIELD